MSKADTDTLSQYACLSGDQKAGRALNLSFEHRVLAVVPTDDTGDRHFAIIRRQGRDPFVCYLVDAEMNCHHGRYCGSYSEALVSLARRVTAMFEAPTGWRIAETSTEASTE